MAYAKVVSGNRILITDNFMVETRKNIISNPDIALAVWNRDWENNCTGFEFRGKAQYFSEGKWRDAVKRIPENKNEPCKGAVLVTVENIKKLS